LLGGLRPNKIPKFGVKVGKEYISKLDELKVFNCIDLQHDRFTKEEMKTLFGEAAGLWLYSRCRGIDPDAVVPSGTIKLLALWLHLT